MPRKARKKSYTGVYHIMLRGINRQTIFEDDEDKNKFIEALAKYKKISGFELYGYCLMDNHVHLLVKERQEPLSTALKRISSSYVYWYNRKNNRCGHLFQERFKSENVESDAYFITALRYIHQNPLKAGLVNSVWDSKWTSIYEYLHKGEITDIDRGLNLFSQDRKSAIERFIVYMQEDNEDQCLDLTQRVKLSDDQVREYFRKLGVTSNSMLQQMNKEKRNEILTQVKKLKGVSIRQISRVTGISKSVIDRIK
ncbi:REP element-mobilizing transposase RayT [Evansella vedderi]|uniref:REP element-mobilizing transposase RayT n=1 Tax=Evansella vedderi TaxID=38282 RepID=A0ABT9ZPR1_9BACI|nr:transposase [Evansella vedderi]MDQ0252834.1 REP element-mobilizing transposase RayT [Evansella vedderi]